MRVEEGFRIVGEHLESHRNKRLTEMICLRLPTKQETRTLTMMYYPTYSNVCSAKGACLPSNSLSVFD